jgi:hypothetical protein
VLVNPMDLAMNPFASTTAPTMKTYNQELKKKNYSN